MNNISTLNVPGVFHLVYEATSCVQLFEHDRPHCPREVVETCVKTIALILYMYLDSYYTNFSGCHHELPNMLVASLCFRLDSPENGRRRAQA